MRIVDRVNIRCLWLMVWSVIFLATGLAGITFFDALTDLLNKEYKIIILGRLMCGAWGLCVAAIWLVEIYYTKPSPVSIGSSTSSAAPPSPASAPAAPTPSTPAPAPVAASRAASPPPPPPPPPTPATYSGPSGWEPLP